VQQALLSYPVLLLIFILTLIALGIFLFIGRRRSAASSGELQRRLDSARAGEPLEDSHHLVPLLLYEKRFPAFCRILVLVLKQFPLQRFLQRSDFSQALDFLTAKPFSDTESEDPIPAMVVIVEVFLSDPDVEYRCRPRLRTLVNQFIREAER
jgi:hypothetical protein